MSDKAARAADYLGHILQAIERIDRYTSNMVETQFVASEITQDAVIRNFEIIGEASRNIERNCPEVAAAHPESAPHQRLRNAQRAGAWLFPGRFGDPVENPAERFATVTAADHRDYRGTRREAEE